MNSLLQLTLDAHGAPDGLRTVRALDQYVRKSGLEPGFVELVKLHRGDGVNDALYNEARAEFSGKEIVDLTVAVIAINAWNRPGATIGSGGTALSQAAWLPVLRFLGMRPWFEGAVLVSDAARQFDSHGHLSDAQHGSASRRFLRGFAAFAAQHGPHTVLAVPNPPTDLRSHGVMATGRRERAVMTS